MLRKRKDGARFGFTLAELTIVVLIIGILAAVAAPRVADSVSNFRAEAAAKRIAADLMYARQEAMNQGVNQSVTFSTLTNKYSMPNVPHPDKPAQAYSVDLSTGNYPVTIVAVGFGGGSSAVTFDINGQPNSAGYVIVDSDGVQNQVNLDAVTGRATVQ